MAILYITTNANSGDGSLRALLASAQEGDVIQPDATAFPVGTPCVITLASTLSITTSVTIRGAQTRLVLSSSTAIGLQLRAPLTFVDVDFVKIEKSGSGGTLWLYAAAEECSFIRCLFAGNKAASGGAFYIASGASVVAKNCAFMGNYATTSGAVGYFAGTDSDGSSFHSCTFAGNVAGSGGDFNRSVALTNCKTTTTGMVVPPPIYGVEDWSASLYEGWNLHLEKTASEATGGAPEAGAYDLDGNPRVENGSVGCYETIFADLYWVGKDAQGDDVDTPSFNSADGWAVARFAALGSGVLPSSVNTLFVEGSLTFASAPSSGSWTLILGGNTVFNATLAGQTIKMPGLNTLVTLGGTATVADASLDFTELTLAVGANVSFNACSIYAESVTIEATQTIRIIESELGAGALVINGSLTTDTPLFVSSLTVGAGAIIHLTGADTFIAASRVAILNEGLISHTARGYLAVPSGTINNATLTNVVLCEYSASVVSFSARQKANGVLLTWTQDDEGSPVLVEVYLSESGEWATVDGAASEPVLYSETDDKRFRVFDGVAFYESVAVAFTPGVFWQVKAWGDPDGDDGSGGSSESYGVSSYAISPNLEEVNG